MVSTSDFRSENEGSIPFIATTMTVGTERFKSSPFQGEVAGSIPVMVKSSKLIYFHVVMTKNSRNVG